MHLCAASTELAFKVRLGASSAIRKVTILRQHTVEEIEAAAS